MEEIKYEYKEREIGNAGDGESLSRGVWKPPDVRRLFSQATWTALRESRKAVPPIVWQNNGPTLPLTVNGIWVENIDEKMFQKKSPKTDEKIVHVSSGAIVQCIFYPMPSYIQSYIWWFVGTVFQVLKIPRINQALIHASMHPNCHTVIHTRIV